MLQDGIRHLFTNDAWVCTSRSLAVLRVVKALACHVVHPCFPAQNLVRQASHWVTRAWYIVDRSRNVDSVAFAGLARLCPSVSFKNPKPPKP